MLRLLSTLTLLLLLFFMGLMIAARWLGEHADVQLIAYFNFTRGVGVIDVDHRLEGLLIADETVNVNLGMAWSPDGRQLAYEAGDPTYGTMQLYVFDLATRTRRNVANKPFDAMWPSWSPDGSMLSFTSFPRVTTASGEEVSVGTGVYVVDAQTGEEVSTLTQPPDVSRFSPGWSPDGRLFSVTVQTSVSPPLAQIHVLDVNRGEPVLVLDPNTAAASWSPDSHWLLFTIQSTGSSGLGVANLETSEMRQLVESIYSFPMVSPDSKTIAYTALEPGLGGAREMLRLIDIDSGKTRAVTDHLYSDSHPTWSPDGRWLLVDSSRNGFEQLFLMDTTTEEWQALTDISYFPNLLPVWSPDSRWVSFSSSISGRAEIYIVSVPDGEIMALTNYDTNFAPIWQP